MATKIWDAASVTPAATDRIPVDVSSSGAPSRWTGQNIADAPGTIGVTTQALGSINTNTTITWSSGSYVTATIAGALTFTFAGAPSTGQGFQGVLVLTNGGSAAITWPGSVTWMGGTAPTLTASGVNVLYFVTSNGGTNWYGWTEYDEPEIAASMITSGTLDAARLPAPTTTALGGVMRNTGSAGQFVTGIHTDGSLLRDTPAGGLSEPLTTPRFTRQSSALSAASAGETKLQFRDIVRAALVACKADVGDERILMPGLGDPGLYGWYTNGGAVPVVVGGSTVTGTSGSGTPTASAINNSIGCVNLATAASANAPLERYVNELILRDGSAQGDGFLSWGFISLPDGSYGSGATGVSISLGVHAYAALPNSNARPSGRCVVLQYNTGQSDSNWQLIVNNGSNTLADTGLAFATGAYFWMIHCPRGTSSCYGYIKNIGGSSGSATVAATPGSTAMVLNQKLVTLDAVARNMRQRLAFSLIPMEF